MSERKFEMIPFHNTQLEAVRDGADVWVSLRRMCEAIGLSADAQRIKVLKKPWAVTAMKAATGADGKVYEAFCLHIDSVPMWLATIEPGRVSAAARPMLILFQKEAAEVLRNHFMPQRAATPMAFPVDPSDPISVLEATAKAMRFIAESKADKRDVIELAKRTDLRIGQLDVKIAHDRKARGIAKADMMVLRKGIDVICERYAQKIAGVREWVDVYKTLRRNLNGALSLKEVSEWQFHHIPLVCNYIDRQWGESTDDVRAEYERIRNNQPPMAGVIQ